MQSEQIKQILYGMGADLCGIATADRLEGAPEGFHPRDVLPTCRSVIVFAKRFPAGTLAGGSTVPYTIVRNLLTTELDLMSVRFCCHMEEERVTAVPTGTIGPTLLDNKTGRGRNVVSVKHCAQAAGLGRIGRNTLLVTPEYGNMVWLCAVLTDALLEPDPPLTGNPCPAGCSLCVDSCPVRALDTLEMNQRACRAYAFHVEPGNDFHFRCHTCRTICPNCLGERNAPAANRRAGERAPEQ